MEFANDKLFSISIAVRNNTNSENTDIYNFRINLSLTALRDYTIADRNEQL